jgi:DNA-binding NarL/FixJ family response regulator
MKDAGLLQLVIADPRQLMCEGLQCMLACRTGMLVRAAVQSTEALLAALAHRRPDVLLLNPRLGSHGGTALIEELRALHPRLPVLVLASDADSDDPVALMKAGARGYLSRDDSPDDLMCALSKVGRGGLWVSRELGERIAEALYGNARTDSYAELSPREAEVFCLLARGQTVSQIGMALGLSVKTVSTHKRRVMERLGLGSLSDLVRYALSHGLMEQAPSSHAPICGLVAAAPASDTAAG